MYGGHITDAWDRRTNNTYLMVLVKPELMSNCNLSPGFKSPDPTKFDYEAYRTYIETKLPVESPILFGMHPNAEIGYLTTMCDTIFETILSVQGGSGGGSKKDSGSMSILLDLKNRTPIDFNLFDINTKIKDKTPYVVVVL
jgi:dynein heavy chain